jgi:hypothetical protein
MDNKSPFAVRVLNVYMKGAEVLVLLQYNKKEVRMRTFEFWEG